MIVKELHPQHKARLQIVLEQHEYPDRKKKKKTKCEQTTSKKINVQQTRKKFTFSGNQRHTNEDETP